VSRRPMLLILPGLCLVLTVTAFWRSRSEPDLRPALLGGALVGGVLLVGITEGLSLLSALTRDGLALAWLAATIAAAIAAWRLKAQPKPPSPFPTEFRSKLGLAMGALIVIVLLITAFTSLLGWPNTYDAMAYHLARVAHWT